MLPRHPPWLATLMVFLCTGATFAAAPRDVGLLQLEKSALAFSVLTDGFDAGFDLAWGPDNHLWCTQLDGTVWRIDPSTGVREEVLRLTDVFYRKSHGLQSLAFHPDFAAESYVYLHYVFQGPPRGQEETVLSRLVRCRWDGHRLGAPETLFDAIPGKSFHNGSRLIVGPDRKLYLSTGDAGKPMDSQDPSVLSGKILRLNLDGSIPADNPFPGSPVWTSGHRNPQGLVFSPSGRFYESEHGPNNDDEVNLLEPGRNYGWPVIEGFVDRPDEIASARGKAVTEPLRAWSPTIAPSGLEYYAHPAIPEWRNSLLLVNLKGRALRVLQLSDAGDKIERERIYLQKYFGRLRDVVAAPNGDLYILTSNTDWHPRFQPWMYDSLPPGPDHILRLHAVDAATAAHLGTQPEIVRLAEDKEPLPLMSENWNIPATTAELKAGQDLFLVHCATCHQPNGLGAPGLIPPLAGTDWVTHKDKNRLIQVVLRGLSGRIVVNDLPYEQEMPAFQHLPDADLAAILTYIRASFGNQASAVIPNEVFEERKSLH